MDQHLDVNLGFNHSPESIPSNWKPDGKHLYTCPVTEIDSVLNWVSQTFSTLADTPAYRVTGWIEG